MVITKNPVKSILQAQQTVFSFKDMIIRLRTGKAQSLKSRLHYYVNRGELYPIRRGLYAKDSNYNRWELAVKIFTPSYVSFETVLFSAGIIFQYTDTISVASYQSRSVTCDGQAYQFRRLKRSILLNTEGVTKDAVATPERAFLDTIYLYGTRHFDNLDPINWKLVYEILPIYGSKGAMKTRVDQYYALWRASLR
jgi:hypothetical protein